MCPAARSGSSAATSPTREAVRQGLDHAPGRRGSPSRHRGRLHRLARPRHRARRRRPAARPRRRDLRPGVVGQDHADAARHRRGPEARRHRAFIDAEHALDPAYAASSASTSTTSDQLSPTPASRRSRSPTCWCAPARSTCRHRLGRRADAQGRDRGRDGRQPRGPAGAPDEPGAAQAHRQHQSKTNTMVIFINQIRMKIGVMFGNPETTTGGNALKFYASVRLDIRRIGAIKKGEEVIGNRDPRQGGQEQGGAAVPRGRVRHPVRRGHLARGRDHRPGACAPAASTTTSRTSATPRATTPSSRCSATSASATTSSATRSASPGSC
jgi:hypothetical protein